jgi:hypothetical protein
MVLLFPDQASRARHDGFPPRASSSLGGGASSGGPHGPSFKQSSISSGTLGRPRTPNSHRPRTRDQRPPASPTTSVPGAGQPMAGMLDNDRARSRRERTFVGGECAACEELLEHTLRGERVLQFSCGHVAHEACFYEYIKDQDSQYCPTCEAPLSLDSFRGGSILDLSTLSPRTLRMTTNFGSSQVEQHGPRCGLQRRDFAQEFVEYSDAVGFQQQNPTRRYLQRARN